jgi:multicomponent Na+:H+ antiporter subunit G
MSETAITAFQAGVVIALVTVGSFFLLIGTIGLLRLPTIYNRMHATSKATTLGAASLFLAGAVYFDPVTVPVPALGGVPVVPQGEGLISLIGILFLFATAPTGAHVISRSAQVMGVPFLDGVRWPDTVEEAIDEAEAED